jgi:hypothetical protein
MPGGMPFELSGGQVDSLSGAIARTSGCSTDIASAHGRFFAGGEFMVSIRHAAAALVAAASMVISACGGGGGSGVASPVVAAQPANAAVLTDGTATFSVTAAGTGLTYQWKRNGADIPGATAATYTTPAASFADNGAQYTVAISNAGGTVTSSAAQLTLTLSPDQQAFESLILAPNGGSYVLHWNLNFSGAQASGTNFAYSDNSVLTASPLTSGPQSNPQSAPHNLAATLALVTSGPTRVLKNGAVLVAPNTGEWSKATYVGGSVRVDSLAADNSTVAYSSIRSNYHTVALTGTMATTSPDFAHYHNSFFSNLAILNATAAWGAGSSYITFTQTNLGDRYNAFDCGAATADANVTPCATGTTLTSALTTGITSSSDATTYHLSDGTMRTVGGVQVWVADAARPQSATLSTTLEYTIYYALNGNVYTGALIKDGAQLGGSYYVSNPTGATVTDRLTFLPFGLRMNKAAHDSVAAAMNI